MTIDDRDWKIYVRRQAGETYQAIGMDYGLSRERVRQIVNRHKRILNSFTVDNLTKWWNSATQEQRDRFLDRYRTMADAASKWPKPTGEEDKELEQLVREAYRNSSLL
jgi:hypothetical protein